MPKMEVLKYLRPGQAEIVELESPQIAANQVLTRSIVSNVSAGTEMSFYRGTAPQLNYKPDEKSLWEAAPNCLGFPMQSNDAECWWMGYANVSKVVEAGPTIQNLRVGDLVFSKTSHRSVQVLDESECLKLPTEINPEHASFLTLTEICFNAMLDSDIKLTDNIVIIGMGTLGQLLAQMCKLAGATVIAVDYIDSRLRLAAELGADNIINPKQDGDTARKVYELLGQGADCVLEVSGNSAALSDAVRSVRKNGQVTVVSFYQKPPVNFEMGREFHHNRITVKSSQIGGIAPEETAKYDQVRRQKSALELVLKIQLEPLISHRCDFRDYPEMLKMISGSPEECQSVIIKY